jgi:hypothetical protein
METMFSIGDLVQNQRTGNIGKVVGYGYEIFEGTHSTTLKVLIRLANNSRKKKVIEEDVYLAWVKYSGT